MFAEFSKTKIIPIDDEIDDFFSNIFDDVSPRSNPLMGLMNDQLLQSKRRNRNNDNQFIISINVGEHYQLGDITIQTVYSKLKVSGNCIEILENERNFYDFKREYDLPTDIDLSSIRKRLSRSGILYIVFDKAHRELKSVVEDISKDNEFRVKVNFHGYKPEEISVNILGRNVAVEGLKRSQPVYDIDRVYTTCTGYISRVITMGDEIDIDQLKAKISPDGETEIFAPMDLNKIPPGERKLQIKK